MSDSLVCSVITSNVYKISFTCLFVSLWILQRTYKKNLHRPNSFISNFFLSFQCRIVRKKNPWKTTDINRSDLISALLYKKKVRLFGSKYEDKTFNDNTLMSYWLFFFRLQIVFGVSHIRETRLHKGIF